MTDPTIRTDKLSKFRPTLRNPNAHTKRALVQLEESMEDDGYIAPMTVAADGESLDGSARMEVAFEKFGDEAIVVEHDGTKPVVMVRTDIPNANTRQAKRITACSMQGLTATTGRATKSPRWADHCGIPRRTMLGSRPSILTIQI